jgi:hypothetical protein
VAFVADADLLIVLDVLVPVLLGVDIDLLLALAVFDAQLLGPSNRLYSQTLKHFVEKPGIEPTLDFSP